MDALRALSTGGNPGERPGRASFQTVGDDPPAPRCGRQIAADLATKADEQGLMHRGYVALLLSIIIRFCRN